MKAIIYIRTTGGRESRALVLYSTIKKPYHGGDYDGTNLNSSSSMHRISLDLIIKRCVNEVKITLSYALRDNLLIFDKVLILDIKIRYLK